MCIVKNMFALINLDKNNNICYYSSNKYIVTRQVRLFITQSIILIGGEEIEKVVCRLELPDNPVTDFRYCPILF